MARISAAWRRLVRRDNRERGFVEAGVATAGAVLVVGALVGNGVASTVMDMSDGQTWLPDEDGRIVQINPATGQPERRLVVGGPGSELDVAQRDGHLVVTDLTTGAATAIDLTGLIASGTRGLDGDDSLVLLGGGMVVIVDRSPGTVRAVDPLTLADLGRPYRTEDLADAVIDDAGEVWLVTTEGQLRSLTFDSRGGTWSVGTDRPVDGAGARTRLTSHPQGVTVFAPDGGVVLQTGRGADIAVSVPALEGGVEPALRSPADLVPAAVPQAGLVVLLADGTARTVAVSEIGCARPGAPQVFNGLVYVPCQGDGRVVVLDRTGARAAEDIIVPGGGDPELVVDEGRLIVRSPGDGRIVLVQPDGSSAIVDIAATETPVQDAERAAPTRPAQPATAPAGPAPHGPTGPSVPNPPPPAAGSLPTRDVSPAGEPRNAVSPERRDEVPAVDGRRPTGGAADPTRGDDDAVGRVGDYDGEDRTDGAGDVIGPDDPGAGALPGDPTDGAGDPTDGAGDPTQGTGDPTGGAGDPTDGTTDPDPADRVPGSVNATLRADGTAQVSWAQPAEQPERFVVSSSDRAPAVTVPHTQASAELSGLTCDRTVTVRVEAQYADGDPGVGTDSLRTADCAQPTPDQPDPEPTDVSAQRGGDGTVTVTWTPPAERPASYVVAASDGSSVSAGGAATSATLSDLTCGRTLTITVTAHHSAELQGSASTTVRTADCPADPAPSAVTAQLQGEDVAVAWTPPADRPSSYTVAASDGSGSVTAGGGATSATLSDLTCERTLTITVTAHHSGGVDGSATTSVTTAACPPPEPDPATPAGNVSAEARADGSVQVTWTAASSGADRYVVRPVGGSGTTAGASAREVSISGLVPGSSHRFEVETQLGDTTAVSAASNQVTVANVPGAVSGLSAGVVDRNATTVRVSVSFNAAPSNGSPVTGYVVAYSGSGVSGSTTIGGTSTTLTISCSGQALCTSGGSLNISVQATSAVGNGGAVNTAVTVAAPPPPPPANGDTRVGSVSAGTPGLNDPGVPMVANLQSHASWSAFSGTCQVNVSGAVNNSFPVDCGASGQIYLGEAAYPGAVHVSVTTSSGVTSNTASGEAPPRNTWAYCDLTTGLCTEPVSLPTDPGGNPPVEIIPAPWTPPEVPNPPVLLAGAFLLGAAGTLRHLRRTLSTPPTPTPAAADSSIPAGAWAPTSDENRTDTV